MTLKVEYKTIATLSNYVVLSGIPADGTVALDVVSGTAQAMNSDFGVSDTTVLWNSSSYNLYNNGAIDSTGLAVGDQIRIMYDKTTV